MIISYIGNFLTMWYSVISYLQGITWTLIPKLVTIIEHVPPI